MAFVSSHKSRILIADFHLSPKVRQFSTTIDNDVLDTTTLVDTAKAFTPGNHTSTFTANGPLDTSGDANDQHDQFAAWTTAEPVTLAPSGLAVGAELFLVNALRTEFASSATSSSTVDWNLAAQTDGLTAVGKSLADLAALTATTEGTAVDNAASTANGGVAHLHVTAFSGFTGVVVTVEHSTNNSVWATLGTFTNATGATAERITIAAGTTVNRYLRALVTVTGTGSITLHCGFARS